MPLDDPQQSVPNTADDATPSNSPAAPIPLQQPTQPTPKPVNPQSETVSNAPASPIHPSVERAGLIRTIAETLAGGPRVQLTANPDGTVTRTRVPLSKTDIGLALAMEALSGSVAGLSQRGPAAVGMAAQAGFQQIAAQRQQADIQQEQQAQADAKAKSDALVRQAQAFEQNSRVILNTSQSERFGVESLRDAVSMNAQLLNDYDEAGAVQEQHVPQDVLSAGLKNGTYDVTKQIAIPDGFTNINGRYEQTFSIVADPRAKVPLTQAQAEAFGNAGLPGFLPFASGKSKIGPNVMVPGTMIARANQQLQANGLMKLEYNGVVDALSKSEDKSTRELAKSIPSIQSLLTDPQSGPAFQSALSKFQRYVSHSDVHGMDFYHSLQQMAVLSKPNPQNPKQMISNPDAQAAQTIAGAFGNGDPTKGWAILKAYSGQVTPTSIKSDADATNILASSDSTPKQIAQAKRYLELSQQQKAANAGAEARAKKAVEGNGTANTQADVQQASDAIAAGKGTFEQLTSGMGKEAAAFRRQVEADLLRRYPNVNITALKAYSKAADSQAVQSQVTNARSLFGTNGQPGSFDALEDAIRAVPKARFPILSEFGQKTAYQLGSTEMSVLKAIKTDIASDLAKFNAGGGNHSSDHQIELYREQLNEAQTPEQVEAVLKDLRAISSKRLVGIVGANPYLANMTADINDPVTRQPRGVKGVQVPQLQKTAPPAGATMKVPGSDGKLHWSDGRRDLGVVQ
jgi:hypothetical protein